MAHLFEGYFDGVTVPFEWTGNFDVTEHLSRPRHRHAAFDVTFVTAG